MAADLTKLMDEAFETLSSVQKQAGLEHKIRAAELTLEFIERLSYLAKDLQWTDELNDLYRSGTG